MKRHRFGYALASMTFLAVMSWLSVRTYNNLIGRISYGPLKGYFDKTFHLSDEDLAGAAKINAAIFYSNATASSFKDPETYTALINAWKKMFDDLHIANNIVDEGALTGRSLRSYTMLVLPFATRLSDNDVGGIKAFVSQPGHGLIFCGAAGSARANGDGREISLAAEIIGGEGIREIAPNDGKPLSLVLNGRNPLTANLPPGLRLGVNTYDRPVSVTILEPRTQTAGTWLEDGRAGIASGSYRDGRFVWTGFTLGSTIDPYGVKAGDILLRNFLAYAAFKPIFAKESWPGGKQAAVTFAEETGESFADTATVTALFVQKRVPVTFFVAPEAAIKDPAGIKALASNSSFEIGQSGTQSDQELPLDKRVEMLANGKRTLEGLSGRTIMGFSPFEAQYDKNTIQTLLDLGYSYLAGDINAKGPPSVLQARKPPLLRIGRDLNLFMQLPHAPKDDAKKTFEQLKQEFDAIYRVGGFYNVSFHASLLEDPEEARVLAQFLDYVKSKNVWFTTFGAAADWSSRWMLVDVDSANTSKVRSNLIVTNNSPDEIDSLRLNVYYPDDVGSVTASSEKLGGSINVISQQNGKALLDIRGLRGKSLVFYVDTRS